MVNSGDLNGVSASATADLEKGEVLEEDLEKGETYQTFEGGNSEKRIREAASGTAEPNLTEPLLTPEEARHEELAAASKPLVCTEKVFASLLVVCFVLAEAYFVGHSFRNWFKPDEHLNVNNTMSTDKMKFDPVPSPLELPILLPIDADDGGGREIFTHSEYFDDVSFPLNLDDAEPTVSESSEGIAPLTETSTTMARLPAEVEIDGQMLARPLLEKVDGPISAENGHNCVHGGS